MLPIQSQIASKTGNLVQIAACKQTIAYKYTWIEYTIDWIHNEPKNQIRLAL